MIEWGTGTLKNRFINQTVPPDPLAATKSNGYHGYVGVRYVWVTPHIVTIKMITTQSPHIDRLMFECGEVLI